MVDDPGRVPDGAARSPSRSRGYGVAGDARLLPRATASPAERHRRPGARAATPTAAACRRCRPAISPHHRRRRHCASAAGPGG
ncbi:MAG: hypothetical protein MZW92_05070 [Comamonadaceae bacterium]|nr:hypothetical protein [Comamonadaceae bacterium]